MRERGETDRERGGEGGAGRARELNFLREISLLNLTFTGRHDQELEVPFPFTVKKNSYVRTCSHGGTKLLHALKHVRNVDIHEVYERWVCLQVNGCTVGRW